MSDTPNIAAINAAIEKLKSIPAMKPEDSQYDFIRDHRKLPQYDTCHTVEEFPSEGGITITRHVKWRSEMDGDGVHHWKFECFDFERVSDPNQ